MVPPKLVAILHYFLFLLFCVGSAKQDIPAEITIPNDLRTDHIVYHIDLSDRQKADHLVPSPYSDYFAISKNGDITIQRNVASLGGKKFRLAFSLLNYDGIKELFHLQVSVTNVLSSGGLSRVGSKVPHPIESFPQSPERNLISSKNGSNKRNLRRVKREQPRLTKELTFSEADGSVEGRAIFQLEKENPLETFTIRDSNSWVQVDPNGAVTVKKKWDFEKLGPGKNIEFWVSIENGNQYATQRIVLQITDVNDEPPFFVNRPLPIQAVVDVNAPPNTTVLTLQARDPDKDHDIHYFLVRDRTGGRFEVDERTGEIRTRGSELFHLDTEYVLYVKAEDHNGRNDDQTFQSTVEERISIVGGKRPPQFYLPKYEKNVSEDAPEGYEIIMVKAKSFTDKEIRYSLVPKSGGAGTFSIETKSGIVKLAKKLDFEDASQPHTYELVIKATEDSGGFSTLVDLTIKILDANDNAPKFDVPDYQAHNIDEDIPIGSSILQVKAHDEDSSTNADIVYSVSNDHFRVDDKGIIYNDKVLDANDNNAYYEFTVTATDKGQPPKEGTATVRIYTNNKNDEKPMFSKTLYTSNLNENAGRNTWVMTVVASDKDGDNVEYDFAGATSDSSQFVIEKMTGEIHLHNGDISLGQPKYEFNVTAVDDGTCCTGGTQSRHTSTALVSVLIADVNDNKPIFKDCASYSPKVEESVPTGSHVITVHASDDDKGRNGQVKYSIVQSPHEKEAKFTINPDLNVVTTNKVFDREGGDGKFASVIVKATDGGYPSLESFCSFTVEIIETNDNPPVFGQTESTMVATKDTNVGTNLLKVVASDADSGQNGVVSYSFASVTDSNDLRYFDIHPDSGWITLQKPFDKARYELHVIATDRGETPLSSETVVIINVLDPFNLPPAWDTKVYGPILLPDITDVDQIIYSVKKSSSMDDNPLVYYELIRGPTPETNQRSTFYLRERFENGIPLGDIENNRGQQLQSEKAATVQDVNNKVSPLEETKNIEVLSGINLGRTVAEGSSSPNNEIFYRIASSSSNAGSKSFRTSAEKIYILEELTSPKKKTNILKLEVHDGVPSENPSPNETSNAVVKFLRVDVIDRTASPIFDQMSYEAEVSEDMEPQRIVLTVFAKSLNDESQITYKIVNGSSDNAFTIKKNTGDIYVSGTLDYETKNRYQMEVVASDGKKEAYAKVLIKIVDANDNLPTFKKKLYELSMEEEISKGLPKQILKVEASDADANGGKNLVYFLVGEGIDEKNIQNSHFQVDSASGVIYLAKPLNRDYPKGHPLWQFKVFAQDEGGLLGHADVKVTLTDINDRPPQFSERLCLGSVTENGDRNTVITTIHANDYDDPKTGNNTQIMYSIKRNVVNGKTGEPVFQIDPLTGVIRTASCCLDREETPVYTIQVEAVDGSGLRDTVSVRIRVNDVNDNPPKFTQEEWLVEIDETDGDILPDHAVLNVTVKDKDETNKFFYKVVESSGLGADKFTMITNRDGSGSLKVKRPLDYEDAVQREGFRFRIQVNDKGQMNNTDHDHIAYSWVNVKLRDINDNPPQFTEPNLEIVVRENAPIGKSLAAFHAEDPDNDGQSQVSYGIHRSSDQNRHFTIDGTGTVKIQRNLDREENSRHEVKILAFDDGKRPKTATAVLTVIVEDVNDNAPRLLEDYRPVVPEHRPPQDVVDILATDDDERSKGHGGPFHFQLDPAASDEIKYAFKVTHIQKGPNGDGMGVVSSLRSFDREHQKEFHIPIVIKDAGTPQKTGTSTLTIVVGDENDNKMQAGTKSIHVYRYKTGNSQHSRMSVGRVNVHDLDDWDLPDKTFRLIQGPGDKFSVNEDNGMIFMEEGTPEGSYEMKFHVNDQKHKQRDIEANVTITVKDITEDAINNSGSIRIIDTTAEEFVRTWDKRDLKDIPSKYDKFRNEIASILGVGVENVHVFGVQSVKSQPQATDVRFYVQEAKYFHPIRLNGLVLQHLSYIEQRVGINITMVSIDECIHENTVCKGSCTSYLEVSSTPYMINANKTSFVGIETAVFPECTCSARNFLKEESCLSNSCYNGGVCSKSSSGIKCDCLPGFNGPLCQMTTRSFTGNGVVWLPPIKTCDKSHISLEFMSNKSNGVLFYNGPMITISSTIGHPSDFISLELINGMPKLLMNFGSGTLELAINTKKPLHDGDWHRVDILWDTENVRMDVDRCLDASLYEPEDGREPEIDASNCQAVGKMPLFNEYLNVNSPLILGGLEAEFSSPSVSNLEIAPQQERFFDGCIRNFIVNSEMYDLANPAWQNNTQMGCPSMEHSCKLLTPECGLNGICEGSVDNPVCICKPGWHGPSCDKSTTPSYFDENSYVRYALAFRPDSFKKQLQLRFRTWEENGQLFHLLPHYPHRNKEYSVLELKNGHLRFRYNLNKLDEEERDLWLSAITVNDGEWHSVQIERYGSMAELMVDGGGGRRSNETLEFSGHMLMEVDKLEGVYVGGKAEYTGIRTFVIHDDFKFGCLDDVRIDGELLPLPPHLLGTAGGQAIMARKIQANCSSPAQCGDVVCPAPLKCKDLWMKHDCVLE